jgi:hypothetical protein
MAGYCPAIFLEAASEKHSVGGNDLARRLRKRSSEHGMLLGDTLI